MKLTTVIVAVMATLAAASPAIVDTSPNDVLARDDCKACKKAVKKCSNVSLPPSQRGFATRC
jgi:hypothetical protein